MNCLKAVSFYRPSVLFIAGALVLVSITASHGADPKKPAFAAAVKSAATPAAVKPTMVTTGGNLLGLPAHAYARGGSVMLCGGGSLPDEIYDEFVRLAGGERARLVLIPSAYPYDDMDHIERAFGGWKEYDVVSFDFLHTDDPDEADSDDFVTPLLKATGVWIAGGAQGRLVYRYSDRKVAAALRGVVERGGVVAGFSAGAAIMSRKIIRYGSSTEAVMDVGFGVLDRAVVDSHFSQRGRHTRLLGVLDDNPDLLGIGIDEGTALIIRGNRMRVTGESRATVIVPRGPDQPMILHRLKDGDQADVLLVGSPLGTGPATVELLTKAR